MRNGQTPIHIQRWAPADFHADETVKLLKARRDYLKLTFYRTFLDESFMAGGDLPADPESLAAVMSMPLSHVKQALVFFIGLKIFEENGRLYQPRIRRDVTEELEFREVQRVNGKKGGRRASPSVALPNPTGKPNGSPSPPAPFASAMRQSPAPEEELSLPPALDTQEFRLAWEDWIAYRKEAKLKTWKPVTIKAQLETMAEVGPEVAIAAIRRSIENGIQGIYLDKKKASAASRSCDRCAGKGYIEKPDTQGGWSMEKHECKRCQGTGKF